MEWLFARNMAQIEHHFVPEAAVQQVQHGMFHTAHVQVDAACVAFMLGAHPIVLNVLVYKRGVVGWVEVAKFVPARTGPLWHHVYFTPILARSIAKIECHVHPVLHAGKWRDGVGSFVVRVEQLGFEVGQFGQQHGKRTWRNGNRLVVFVVDNWERLAPIALAREQPVAQLVRDSAFTVAICGEPCVHHRNGFGHCALTVHCNRIV